MGLKPFSARLARISSLMMYLGVKQGQELLPHGSLPAPGVLNMTRPMACARGGLTQLSFSLQGPRRLHENETHVLRWA